MSDHRADALARCRAEQAECAEYIRAGGPDRRGAEQGFADWLMEEVLIMLQEAAK